MRRSTRFYLKTPQTVCDNIAWFLRDGEMDAKKKKIVEISLSSCARNHPTSTSTGVTCVKF
jgi:hypothetical protein